MIQADSLITRRQGSVKDVAATITFREATTITAVTCSLVDGNNAPAGTPPITDATGGFVNQAGTTAADTVWYVSYEDLDVSGLGLISGQWYYLKFKAHWDDDTETPTVGVLIKD